MNRIDELQELLQKNIAKVTDLIKKEEEIEVKKKSPFFWIFMIIGIAVVAGVCAYGIYKIFTPDYLDDFDDEIDDFDDDFFDEDDPADAKKETPETPDDEDKFED